MWFVLLSREVRARYQDEERGGVVLLSLSAVFTGKNRVQSMYLANGLCDPMSIRDTRGVREVCDLGCFH